MKLNEKHLKITKWTARILASAILLFGLPFYFGYGNPMPFINPDYTFFDNMWLTIFPFMFIGLALGLKYEKIGGYLIIIPVITGLLTGIFLDAGIIFHMSAPLVPGILYLIVAYGKNAPGE